MITALAVVDDLLGERLAVPLELVDADVVGFAGVFAVARAMALAGYQLVLAIAVDVRPLQVVVLRVVGVDRMAGPGSVSGGVAALLPPVQAVVVPPAPRSSRSGRLRSRPPPAPGCRRSQAQTPCGRSIRREAGRVGSQASRRAARSRRPLPAISPNPRRWPCLRGNSVCAVKRPAPLPSAPFTSL